MLIYTLVAAVLWLPLHELGHYVTARYFGFKPKLESSPYALQVRLTVSDEIIFQSKYKVYVVAFMGVIGVLPMLPLIPVIWMPMVVLVFYSIFEVIQFKYRIKKYLQQKEKKEK